MTRLFTSTTLLSTQHKKSLQTHNQNLAELLILNYYTVRKMVRKLNNIYYYQQYNAKPSSLSVTNKFCTIHPIFN